MDDRSQGGLEVYLVNGSNNQVTSLDYSASGQCLTPGAGRFTLEAPAIAGAPSTAVGPGRAYDVFASGSMFFCEYVPGTSPLAPSGTWATPRAVGGTDGQVHVDSWSMAFPSDYDPPKGNCAAYYTNDGGIYEAGAGPAGRAGATSWPWVSPGPCPACTARTPKRWRGCPTRPTTTAQPCSYPGVTTTSCSARPPLPALRTSARPRTAVGRRGATTSGTQPKCSSTRPNPTSSWSTAMATSSLWTPSTPQPGRVPHRAPSRARRWRTSPSSPRRTTP